MTDDSPVSGVGGIEGMENQQTTVQRVTACVRSAFKPARRNVKWLLSIMLPISFAVTLLKYAGILNWVAVAAEPLFDLFVLSRLLAAHEWLVHQGPRADRRCPHRCRHLPSSARPRQGPSPSTRRRRYVQASCSARRRCGRDPGNGLNGEQRNCQLARALAPAFAPSTLAAVAAATYATRSA